MNATTTRHSAITAPEPRQIARVLTFDAMQSLYINWDHIAQTARELGAHFEVRTNPPGDIRITMFWAYDETETR